MRNLCKKLWYKLMGMPRNDMRRQAAHEHYYAASRRLQERREIRREVSLLVDGLKKDIYR